MDANTLYVENAGAFMTALTWGIFLSFFLILGFYGFWKLWILWYRNRDREEESLKSVLLQVAVPRDNEIKIDAAEQMFASLSSLHKSSRLSFLKRQPHISFELVGLPGDIRFYIHVPQKIRDLVEKQINGAYPDAEILVVEEVSAKQKQSNLIGNEYTIF